MIEFSNGGRLVQSINELPRSPKTISRLYIDVETTSRDRKLDSLNPWYHCWAAGVAITWDDTAGAWYVPVGHADERWNLPRGAVIEWLQDIMAASKSWRNHNVKYDCHVFYNDLGVDWLTVADGGRGGDLICTVVQSKLKNSDMGFASGGYGLDNLSEKWLKEDIRGYEEAMHPYLPTKPPTVSNKDYGRVPADLMGEYACQDVLTNRRLDRFLEATMPEESMDVARTEIDLTSLLVRMERRGMLVRPRDLRVERLKALHRMYEVEKKLHEIVGHPFLPTSTNDCYDVLCNTYGLPVLSWTNQGDLNKPQNPSFDKDALHMYANRVDAPKEVVELMIEYRTLSTFKGLFLEKYEKLSTPIEGSDLAVLHPDHNQCVRTGRMSVKEPNSQQLNKLAKELILPGPGNSFMSCDGSQIEFRSIAHYTQDPAVMRAYAEDPDTDYHQRVADMCGTARRPAKTINFSIAFGQGKQRTVASLATDADVVAYIENAVDELIRSGDLAEDGKAAAFATLARQRGEAVYDTYHETFPNIRRVARQAAKKCRAVGYVRNVRGRRRYLPPEHAHKAFNSLNQSSAADIIKERMVELDKAYREVGCDIEIVTQVHDEILSVGPTEQLEDPRTIRDVVAILEDTQLLRVPMRFNYGVSSKSWREAASQELSMPLKEVANGRRLAHLRRP